MKIFMDTGQVSYEIHALQEAAGEAMRVYQQMLQDLQALESVWYAPAPETYYQHQREALAHLRDLTGRLESLAATLQDEYVRYLEVAESLG